MWGSVGDDALWKMLLELKNARVEAALWDH